MILGFYDDDFLMKIMARNPYLTIVDQAHYQKTESIKARENYYDIIICREFIEHVHDQNKLMNVCHRLLKKNGSLLIETPNVHTWHSKLLFMFSDNVSFFRSKYIQNYDHKHPLFTWSLRQLCKKRFLIIREEFNFGVIPLLRIRFKTHFKLLGDSYDIVLRKM